LHENIAPGAPCGDRLNITLIAFGAGYFCLYLFSLKTPKISDPAAVLVVNDKQSMPHKYTMLGKVRVSRYNVVGVKRQKAIINDNLRSLAASMGGDAVINVSTTKTDVMGDVIAFPRSRIAL